MDEENIKVVERYLDALRKKDLRRAPIAEEIIFANAITGKGAGAENFRAFLTGFLPAMKDLKIISHVCGGEFVATRWEALTEFGLIEIGEFFRIENGEITESFSYFDPRPILS